jgi:hypothetical protein
MRGRRPATMKKEEIVSSDNTATLRAAPTAATDIFNQFTCSPTTHVQVWRGWVVCLPLPGLHNTTELAQLYLDFGRVFIVITFSSEK